MPGPSKKSYRSDTMDTDSKISTDDFARILGDILNEEGANLISIPGVYEIVSEHFNNEVLERWENES